jgi:hypothetical protein
MAAARDDDPRPFLSLIALPAGTSREELVALLGRSTGLSEADLRLRLGLTPPLVLGQVEPEGARAGIRAIQAAGGDAFAATLGELAALGPTMKIRTLAVAGDLEAQLWDGVSARIRPRTIAVLVRGTVKREIVERREPPRFSSMAHRYRTRDSIKAEIESATTRRLETSEKLDIHTRDGSVFQIDGDAFDFKVLGERRGYADNVNANLMLELLKHLAGPEVVVDEYFKLWRPPPGHERLRLSRPARGADDPAFAFYSRWVALMYRHLRSA